MQGGKEFIAKKRTKYIMGGIAAAIVLIGGVYSGMAYSYGDKFIPGTVVDGLDISGKNIVQAEKEMKERYTTSTYTVKENGNEITKVTGEELNMEPDFKKYLSNLNEDQNKWAWGISKFNDSEVKDSPDGIVMDEDKYKAHFEGIEFNSGERAEPVDAKVVFKDDKFVIEPEVVGNTLDLQKVDEKIKSSIKSGKTDIEISDCYVQPNIKKDDKNLKKALDEMNKLVEKQVVYKISGENAMVGKDAVAAWLTYDENGDVSLNEEAVRAYIQLLSEQRSTRGKERDFNGTLSGPIKIGGGIYGWSIDVEEETKELMEEFMNAGDKLERVPVTNGVGFDKDSDSIEKHYVEIDLSNQYMWVYKDGEIVVETPVVTGNPNTGHTTPAGVFYIWSKETNRILRGADYATPVSYWMPIDWSGVGIHDATWQPSFGGSAYLYRGSHGCINTPMGAVAQVYNSVEVGTPVVVHY